MSTAYEVCQYLALSGVGAFPGNTAFCLNVSREPVAPNDAITIYDTGGGEPDTDELDLLSPTFQVRVRCVDYLQGFAKHEEIRDLLILPNSLVMGTHRYVSVSMSSDITHIGRDENDRFLLTANYRCIKERDSI